MTSFAVCTPSRGLIHSRTVEAVEANRRAAVDAGHTDLGWVVTHDLPIPDCHEAVFERALATGAEYVFSVEEDMVPPCGALLASIELHADIAAMQYPVGLPSGMVDVKGKASTGTFNCLQASPGGVFDWCGLGCTLIARRVFETLPRPWFATDKTYEVWHFGNVMTQRNVVDNPFDYGGEDVNFGQRVTELGFLIRQVPGIAGHALLLNWGTYATQDGRHGIVVRDAIERMIP
jgi:hypothetical protein